MPTLRGKGTGYKADAMTKKQVGKVCTEARKAKGWTINRTATESGLKAHQIEGIEDGSKAYTFDSLVQLCSVLGITIEIYFGQRP